ncbi:MAG: polyprenyl synthetase family protein [Nitrospiraceae bacterium]
MSEQPSLSTIETMADVWEAYRAELQGVETQIHANLTSPVALVNTVAGHILSSGGKRVRPLLLVLAARLCGYGGTDHWQLGALMEYIHTATLLHDDVVDDADVRRGRHSARKVWGNQISILVGDYLYSKAMRQVVDFRMHAVNEALADACWKMAEGEVLQLYYNGNPAMPLSDYLKIVEHKTAGLIAAACQVGAMIAGATDAQERALYRFGQRLGIAFQLADDTLDYTANGDQFGKAIGQDLCQGRATLPLLHLLTHCSETDRQMIKDRMETRSLTTQDLVHILDLMHEFGSIAYAKDQAQTYIRAAMADLAPFDDCMHKRALSVAAAYMVTRDR